MPGGNISTTKVVTQEVVSPAEVFADLNNLSDGGTSGITAKVRPDGYIEAYFARDGVNGVEPVVEEYETGKFRVVLPPESEPEE